jgi:hypothetical protein
MMVLNSHHIEKHFKYNLKILAVPVPVLPLTEHHAMKAYWGNGGTVPPIL